MRATKKCTQPSDKLMAIETQIRLRSNFVVATFMLFIGLFASTPSKAQLQLPDVLTEHLKSDDYARIYSGSMSLKELKRGNSGISWRIWSDRDNNSIYASTRKASAQFTARFMEAFEVYDVKRSSSGETFLKIKSLSSSVAKKEGWIPMEKTLVSSKAMANSLGLTKKFMILAPVESVKNGNLNSLDILFYNSPVRARRNGSVVRRFTILFALKEEAGKVLLSTSNDFTQLGPGGKASIAGWTPKSSLTEWNSRVGYAPNHKVAFGEYFDNSLPVNSTKRRAESNWTSGSQSTDLTEYRVGAEMPDNWNVAFPPMPSITKRLETSATDFEKQLREVVVLVCAGDASSCEGNFNQNRAEIEELYRSLQQLNIYFILDGTNSMSPFVRSAKTAIDEIIKSVPVEDRQYYSVGYTIYRDYPDGKFAVVSTEPSNDFDQFSKEIEAIKCFSQAPTRAEAFYQGLIEGIKSANFTNTYAQNLLVIIGDSGNHIEDSLSLEDVKAELEGKKITLFGLQTTNGAHASYLDYNQDILQLASVTSSSGKWVEESESKFTFKSLNSEEIAAWETESSIYVGNAKGEPTDPVQMSDDVAHAIRVLNEKRIEVTEQFFRGSMGGKKLPQISGVTTKFGAIPTSSTGYINTQPDSNKPAAFIPYVFLLEEEYTKLQSAFNLFASARFAAGATDEFTKYLLQTLSAITGDDLLNNASLNKVIMNKTLNEIWNDYLQVPCGLPFADYKLNDLDVAYSKSDKSEWAKSMDQFKEKASDFSQFSDKSEFEWSPVLGIAEPFYWVPFSDFPGAQ